LACEFEFAFPLPQGLHARPAGLIQEKAETFAGDVAWENLRNGLAADAKSVLSLVATDTQFRDPCRVRLGDPAGEGEAHDLRALILEELPKVEARAAEAPPSAASDVPRILALERAVYFQGAPAGPGIVRGRVAAHDPAAALVVEPEETIRSPREEIEAFGAAMEALDADLLRRRDESRDGTEKAIIAAHRAVLRDRAFGAKVREIISGGRNGAASAVGLAGRHYGDLLQASRSAYLRERMADIRDVTRQLVARIGGGAAPDSGIRLERPSILVAEDLAPSVFLALDRAMIQGLILEKAGVTSHTLILCRARGIPAMTGCPGILGKLRTGEEVLLDGGRGLAVPAPSSRVSRYYEREEAAERRRAALRQAQTRIPGRTADGRKIEIAANIGDPNELAAAWAEGAEGVGLFRTEVLLFGRPAPPDEEEQTAVYSRLAAEAGGRPIIVRTFDIGGDKPLPFLALPAESNPFLGCRGVRLYERQADLISTQLRALLRAAAAGPLKIMIPMVAVADEIVRTKELLARAKADLRSAGVPHRPDVEVGIMVEVPAAALFVDRLADQADFFSVGSNDLLQYVFAADRGNPAVRALNDASHPAFLRLLRSVVDQAHARGKWVGLCGELAADVRLLPLLVGLGFDELSMASPSIPEVKARLRGLDGEACRALVEAAVRTGSALEVGEALEAFAAAGAREALIASGLVNLRSDSRTKAEVLQELAALMEASGRTGRRADVETALWRREDTFSTGIGFGVAIPHCQTPAVRSASIGFLRFEEPVAWDAADGQPVDMALMLAIPAAGPSRESLKYLARLSRRLVHEEFRESLRTASDAAAVVRLIGAAVADGQL
jgi:fructose-specific PTS system IIA-like component